jgi:hypothetical protein
MNCIQFRIRSMTVALLLLGVTGCASKTPGLDRNFGEAVTMIKAHQTLSPGAAQNTDPVKGIDGQAAKSAYDEYQKSFKSPVPQPNAFTIGVGAGR